jgi:organic radical activating enzyme
MFRLLRRLISDTGVWAIGLAGGRRRKRSSDALMAALLLPVCLPRVLVGRVLTRLTGKADIPYMDCVVTTACTLRCKKCSNLMQYYSTTDTPPAERIIEDMRHLLGNVRYVRTVGLLGGEPLLAPGLAEIISFLVREPQIGCVQIVTNGTLLPNADLLDAMRHKKVSVTISDYKIAMGRIDELTALLREHKIKHTVLEISHWRDYGDLVRRGRSERERARVMAQCKASHCRTLLNGELHLCQTSAHGKNLGIFEARGDTVDLRGAPSRETARAIAHLLTKQPSIEACDYCDNSSALPGKYIPPAEQEGE